ncbi:MFS transporter [Clavibacter tessellarius]|uniref:MFS transporter n=1 Tax=Clavibacter tessellarius TaxID=31965 RepID=UPI00324CEA15
MPDADPRAPGPRRPLLISRSFALIWVAQALSSFGEYVLAATVTVWLATGLAPGDPALPLYIGAVVAATSVPRLVLLPFAGVLVDRWPARRVMVAADLARAGLLLPLLVIAASAPSPVVIGAVIGTQLLIGCASQLFDPARAALVQVVVPADRRAAAAGRSLLASTGVGILSGLTGPAVYAVLGPHPALVMDAASFLASAALVLAVRERGVTPADVHADGAGADAHADARDAVASAGARFRAEPRRRGPHRARLAAPPDPRGRPRRVRRDPGRQQRDARPPRAHHDGPDRGGVRRRHRDVRGRRPGRIRHGAGARRPHPPRARAAGRARGARTHLRRLLDRARVPARGDPHGRRRARLRGLPGRAGADPPGGGAGRRDGPGLVAHDPGARGVVAPGDDRDGPGARAPARRRADRRLPGGGRDGGRGHGRRRARARRRRHQSRKRTRSRRVVKTRPIAVITAK